MNIYDTKYGVTFADGLPVWQGDPVFVGVSFLGKTLSHKGDL